MSKKRHESFDPGTDRNETAIFLDRLLQWLCDLQSKDIECFEEEPVTELAQALAKKLNGVVFCDFDRQYRNAYSLHILLDEKGNIPPLKSNDDQFTLLKVSQFDVRVDISRKGGFFCLRPYAVSPLSGAWTCIPAQERSKPLLIVCDRIIRFLTDRELIQVPDALLDRRIHGHNELGGEVTVKTQLFGEI
ncbi:MAG: hypothetical protein KME42_03115 [Tildeniella nuda ZEHNDER 1965/U140]|jgi:hypothetical protein|nr:hypothetical protein [Tildeniella nuda ZEHNDER 1965/U140]